MRSKSKVYIISGCCGAGKTTFARALVKAVSNTAIISGDDIHDLYRDEASMGWTDRCKLTWKNMLLLLDSFLQNNIDVIIDYVVEDELPKVLSVTGKYDVELRYIVMTADKELIRERLTSRGDAYLIERALFLHEKLTGDEHNIPYLYDGSHVPMERQIADVQDFDLYVARQ